MKSLWLVVLSCALGFTVYYLLLDSLETMAAATAGLSTAILLLWMLEAIPLPITALLVPVIASLLGLSPLESAFSGFGHPLIYLFLGGFLIAQGMSVSGLDQRIALRILTAPGIQGRPRRTLCSLLLLTAFFSMWISNTATTAMMFPIALGVLNAMAPNDRKVQSTVLISLAYASSIGGAATPIGSTPNILSMGLLRERLPEIQISFIDWVLIATPLSILVMGLLLLRIQKTLGRLPDSFTDPTLTKTRASKVPLSRHERISLLSIAVAVTCWILPSFVQLLALLWPDLEPLSTKLYKHLPEASGALLGASILFILPGENNRPTLSWSQAAQIDWGSLMLFGGGLSLGTLIFKSGLSDAIGVAFVSELGIDSFVLFLLVVVALTVFASEAASNTATASLLIPLVISTSLTANLPTTASVLGVAWACSLAFMLPIGTPPNAIVYGSGKIKMKEMIGLGFFMNLGSIVLITGYLYLLQKLHWLP